MLHALNDSYSLNLYHSEFNVGFSIIFTLDNTSTHIQRHAYDCHNCIFTCHMLSKRLKICFYIWHYLFICFFSAV